jgi:hypothetical protein
MLCSSSACHVENERVNQLTAFNFQKKQHRAFRKKTKFMRYTVILAVAYISFVGQQMPSIL